MNNTHARQLRPALKSSLLIIIFFCLSAAAQDIHVKVDPHGPGSTASATDYTSIQQALDHAPEAAAPYRTIIEIAPGTYHERINVTRNRPRITLLGLGRSPEDVVITNSMNAKQAGGTFFTETAQINGDQFEADNVTFENSAGPTGQAVAAAVRSDRSIFKHCRFLGDQDTLFADFGRQYYVDSFIAGGVDFIFGNATAVFDHDTISEIRNGEITAQSRTSPEQTTGYVIDHSRITHDPIPPAPGKTAGTGFGLGRPWRAYSRVVVMNTELPADLNPAGWSAWGPRDTPHQPLITPSSTTPVRAPTPRSASRGRINSRQKKPRPSSPRTSCAARAPNLTGIPSSKQPNFPDIAHRPLVSKRSMGRVASNRIMPGEGSPRRANKRPDTLISWIPLLAGLANSYGPVAFNYGIALYFLNYGHGFVKRGLIGEFVAPIPHFSRAGLIAVQFTFILAAFAVTYLVCRRFLFGTAEDRALAAALFAAPALLPHIGALFAQPDVTLYLLLLATLATFLHLRPVTAAFVSTGLACLGLLCHEAFSLAFYPLVVAILWDLCRRQRLRWSVAILQVALVIAAFVAILYFGKLKVSPDLMLADAVRRTSVPVQRQLFDVLASSFSQQRALVAHFYRYRNMQILYALTAALSIPYFRLLAALLRRTAHARNDTSLDTTLRLILFALPLTLCCLGHDVSRWIAACAIDATLFLSYLALTDVRARDVLRAWATGPRPFLWLTWFLITGPYGATGIRLAEGLSVLWTGP